jgi:hypothetical protein
MLPTTTTVMTMTIQKETMTTEREDSDRGRTS